MSKHSSGRNYQRKVTSAELFFSRSPYSIVTMVARIKGNVSHEMLDHAVAQVRRRHSLLRVRVKDDVDHAQWFTSEGAQAIPIQVVPRKSADDWIAIHAEASKVPFEFETRPAIRFILVQAPEVSELIILCHHIICDGISLAYLARDLMFHLGDPARDVEVLPDPPPIDLDNLPSDVSQSRLVRFFIKRMNRKWAQDRVLFDHEDYEVLSKAYWDKYNHRILCIELSEAETSALVIRCRAVGTTVNSALTAAFTGAQSFVEGRKPYHARIAVGANLRDRIPNSPGEGMGMYAGAIELELNYDHQRSFWENAREFNQNIRPKLTNKNMFGAMLNWLYLDPTILEAMNFKKLGGLVPSDSTRHQKLSAFSRKRDIVLRLLEREHIESLETKHWGAAVTNLGRMDFPTTYGALTLDRLIMQPGGGIPLANVNLVLGAVTCSRKLSLVVEYAEEAADADTMDKINDKAQAYLLSD